MKIKYDVYFRNYWSKESVNIGFFIDYWKEIDISRGRKLARQYYGSLVKDPNAIFVLGKEERRIDNEFPKDHALEKNNFYERGSK